MSTRSPKAESKSSISPRIRLCPGPDETRAGCHVLMDALCYRRFRQFECLLREESIHARDHQGNGIFHYAILYGGSDTQTIDQLIETSPKLSAHIDERNQLGFTPLLFAAFCGRYDLVLTLLTKTTASPFTRDRLLHKNIFDYVENDIHTKLSIHCSPQLQRLRVRIHSTIPSPGETVRHFPTKNFFDEIPPQTMRSHPETIRLLIVERLHTKHSSADLQQLRNYLNQRYKAVKSTTVIPSIHQRVNSKISIHHLLNLFDPNPRPKILPPLLPAQKPITFKKLSTKVTTINAFARTSLRKKRSSALE